MLLARTLCSRIIDENLLKVKPLTQAKLPDQQQMQQTAEWNQLEELLVFATMVKLFEIEPMSRNNASASKYYQQKVNQLLQNQDPVEKAALEIYKKIKAEYGISSSISFHQAMQALEAQQYERAARGFGSSYRSMTAFSVPQVRSQYLRLLSLRRLGPLEISDQKLLTNCLEQMQIVHTLLQEQKQRPNYSAVQGQYYTTLGGLYLVNGDMEQGNKLLKQGIELGFSPTEVETRLLQYVEDQIKTAGVQLDNL